METVSVEEVAKAPYVSPRSVADRRWRLRVVLVGHRAREDLMTPEVEARARLDRFLLKPSFVIANGGGLHCYWLLLEPFDLPGEAQKAKSYLRRLALHLGGDLNSAVKRMLGVAERVWRFNGRFDFLQRLYVTEVRWQCQS